MSKPAMDDPAPPSEPAAEQWTDVADFHPSRTGAAIARVLRPGVRGPARDGLADIDAANAEIARLHRVLGAYQAALDRHAIVAVTDRGGRILHANGLFCATSGYALEELLGQQHRIVNSGHHPKSFFAEMWRTIAGGKVWHGEICNRAKDGRLYWVDTTVVPLMGSSGAIEAYVSIRYDITERKAAESALQAEVERRRSAETLLTDVIETVPEGIAAFDPDDRLLVFNRAYRDCLARAGDTVRVGASFEDILRDGLENGQYALSPQAAARREDWVRTRIRAHRNPGRKIVEAMADGRWVQIRERRSASGNIVGTRTDITEIKRSEAAVKFHAEHDPLTGVLNRSVLSGRLGSAVAGAIKSGRSGALIVIDLDGFKGINDTMGHAAGDALLVAVAQRLAGAVRKVDSVVRLGGDEFAIVLPGIGGKGGLQAVAERLLAAVQKPLRLQKRTISPRMSLGAAIFPRDGRKPGVLLRNADRALYQAKSNGRGTLRIFSRAMRLGIERRHTLAQAMSAAVTADRIGVAFQPQIALGDGGHTGWEALARWEHEGTAVDPAEFISIAEESGLIVDLGWRVIEQGLAEMAALNRQGFAAGVLAINVAAAQLAAPDFPARLDRMVAAAGLSPGALELELTENILLKRDGGEVAETLAALRRLGFQVALDDFGTGYASLAHLSRYPIDRLKIDRSFVRDMTEDGGAQAIVRATIGLAHSLRMAAVAEGIETPAQRCMLRRFGCDFGQGYLIARPLEPSAMAEHLAGCRPALTA